VGAAGAPVGAGGDVDATGGDYHRAVEAVAAQQPGKGAHALYQGRVVVAGGAQGVEVA